MAGRYDDERERDWRSEGYGRGPAGERWSGEENRAFGHRDRAQPGPGARTPEPRAWDDGSAGRGWQDRDYGGVSPAMQREEYDTGYRAGPGRGGRFYGDDGHVGPDAPAPRHQGYGSVHGAYPDGRRFGSREADERYARAMRHPAPGGTGGYDYERGYGDAGRGRDTADFEDRARDAGDFFRRTGQKISNWFSDVTGDILPDDGRPMDGRSHRGRGPKGYKRSDERILEDVHQHLTDDHWLDASDIEVSVSGGDVSLSGQVSNRDDKHRAERIVETLPGVQHVQNNLRLRSASYTPAGSGSGGVGAGPYGSGGPFGAAREEGDAASVTSATARNKT